MHRNREYGCPVEFSLHVLGGKWKPVILARLKEKPLRYGELRRAIPRLSDKVLTQRLEELLASGLVNTKIDQSIQVYELSAEGDTLRPVLQSLYDWGVSASATRQVRFADSDTSSESLISAQGLKTTGIE